MHVGVDNVNVDNHVGRIMAGGRSGRPYPLVFDGDLLLLVQRLIRNMGSGSTQISKVEGHAGGGMVALDRVRKVDRFGNNEADAAADRSRRRVHCSTIYARRLVNGVCARWYPIVQGLHRFLIATVRTVVDSDDLGGSSLHPVLWPSAAYPKRRRVDRAVRNLAWLPGIASLWTPDWARILVAGLTAADVRAWPFSVGLLVKVSHFLGSLHWPIEAGDLGVGGFSYLELLILWVRWPERMVLEKAVPYGRRVVPPISVSAVPIGPGIDIWRTCRLLGSILRFLDRMLGGLGRILPCRRGADHCRLRHVGWEKCVHGLSSRPGETAPSGFWLPCWVSCCSFE